MSLDDVGVVVIGRNEGDRLVACLTSIKPVTSKVVYVDSGSTDGSVTTAQRFAVSVINLDLTQPFTAARARNEGARAIKARNPGVRFIQFMDGDCILSQGWLDSAVAFIKQRSDLAIVSGRLQELHPTASIYNQLCDFEWNTPIGETAACGGNSLMRVEAFEAAGGFADQLIGGEEPELCLRLRELGWKIWRIKGDMAWHDAGMTRFSQWWVRSIRTGYAWADIWLLHRPSPLNIWNRAIASAVFWGALLPAIICLGAAINTAALWGALAYPVQIGRIAFQQRSKFSRPWIFAVMTMASKFAFFQGIVKFCWLRLRGQAAQLIEYKA